MTPSFIILCLFCVGAFAAPTENALNPEHDVSMMCHKLCLAAKDQYGIADWDQGPCLSDQAKSLALYWPANDWVCDVAHSPRQSVDDMVDNQCKGFVGNGGPAANFVEVDVQCNVVQAHQAPAVSSFVQDDAKGSNPFLWFYNPWMWMWTWMYPWVWMF